MMRSLLETPVAAPHSLGFGAMLLRLCGALALVILLILALAWLTRRAGWARPQAQDAPLLRIMQSQTLGQRERVVLLEVQDRWLLLGVSPGNVTLLSEIARQRDAAEARALPAGAFQQALRNALRKKGRAG